MIRARIVARRSPSQASTAAATLASSAKCFGGSVIGRGAFIGVPVLAGRRTHRPARQTFLFCSSRPEESIRLAGPGGWLYTARLRSPLSETRWDDWTHEEG